MIRSHVRLALAVLARRKVFTAISLFGVALTLIVLTVTAALLDHSFAPHGPEVRQDRTLVALFVEMAGETATTQSPGGYRLFDGYTRGLPGVETMSLASTPSGVHSFHGGRRHEITLRRTDADYWRILSFSFLEGGPFGDADVTGARRVAVINRTLRERYFSGASAVGRTLEADGDTWTIIGVVPDVPLMRLVSHAEMWVPLTTQPGDTWRTQLSGNLMALYLLAPGAAPSAVQSEFMARMKQVDLAGTEFDTVTAVPDSVLGSTARAIFAGRRDAESKTAYFFAALAALALLFALLPTVNLVNLAVSRIFERASEIGVRKAFGAPTHTLVLQFVLENVVLTLMGGVVALFGTVLVLRTINASGLIPYADLTLNWRILGEGLLLALAFGVLSGAWPAWRMARLHPVAALKGGLR